MDQVDGFNRYARSWGFCSPSLFKNIKYILDIFQTSFRKDIIKKNEYRNYLMIITNNCNQLIEKYLPIDKTTLEYQIYYEKQKEIAKNTITVYNGENIYINDTTELNIKFKDEDKSLTYEEVFIKYNLLNDTYNNTIFKISTRRYLKNIYVRIEKNTDNNFNIINIQENSSTNILNNNIFVDKYSQPGFSSELETTITMPFISIAIINNEKKALEYNKQADKKDDIEGAIGGYAKSSKFKTKEVLGKLRRVYKIPNSKKEHIKHKGNLITVSEYKAVMKLKNKIYK